MDNNPSDDWNPTLWLTSRHVKTPDVLSDIQRFLLLTFDQTSLDNLDKGLRKKLAVVAERLEFIDHLEHMKNLLLKHKKTSQTPSLDPKSQFLLITEIDSINIDGHDFAGVDYDIEALSLYLLLTCVDTLQGQSPYEDPFDWLERKCHTDSTPDWRQLATEYATAYGLSRLFKAAFTDRASPDLQFRIARNLAVVKVRGQMILPESAKAWSKRNQSEKVSRIAGHLYELRSSFTHASLRTFRLATPVALSLDLETDHVLIQRVGGETVTTLVCELVRYLAQNLAPPLAPT
jgi:hypothetical protein